MCFDLEDMKTRSEKTLKITIKFTKTLGGNNIILTYPSHLQFSVQNGKIFAVVTCV